MNEIPNKDIADLHTTYEQCTGIPLPLNRAFNREYSWGVWMANGWTAADLRMVVTYLKRNFKEHWLKMCRFSRLIEDVAGFEEWLSMAQAEKRNARPTRTERQAVLKATGRRDPEPENVRPAADVAAQLVKGYDELRKAIE